jgi:hypothetical protein
MRRINALVCLAVLLSLALPALAAPKSKPKATGKGARVVTVTLVRWPYT